MSCSVRVFSCIPPCYFLLVCFCIYKVALSVCRHVCTVNRVSGEIKKEDGRELAMVAGSSANTHTVCRLCSLFLRIETQAPECASTTVVRLHMNECLLSLSANSSLLFDFMS